MGHTSTLRFHGGTNMNYESIIRSAFLSLIRNKVRSALTVLGITIGISAVICVVAIGKAGQLRVEQQLNLGDNLVWIEEGGAPSTASARVRTA